MVIIDEHINDFNLEAALRDISPERRQQALRFKHEQGQRTCVLAYQLLKRALQQEFGITGNPRFVYEPHGKPLLAEYPHIHFSISHCREAVACAVSLHPVGIDVESLRQYKERLAAYTMSDDELALIAAAERPDAAFIRLWTMKEARLKLTGEGITDHLKTTLDDSHLYRFQTVECLDRHYIYTLCEPSTV